MLPCASFFAPWAVMRIDVCLSSWQLAHTGFVLASAFAASARACGVAQKIPNVATTRLAINPNRIGHLPGAQQLPTHSGETWELHLCGNVHNGDWFDHECGGRARGEWARDGQGWAGPSPSRLRSTGGNRRASSELSGLVDRPDSRQLVAVRLELFAEGRELAAACRAHMTVAAPFAGVRRKFHRRRGRLRKNQGHHARNERGSGSPIDNGGEVGCFLFHDRESFNLLW